MYFNKSSLLITRFNLIYFFTPTDESDHYYESLHPTDEPGQPVIPANSTSHLVKNDFESQNRSNASDSQPKELQLVTDEPADEEYDSFDSDEGSDEDVRKNDSGVDVSNNRLPDPPTSTNQVYAFMQKIRNFGSLSKNLSKLSKKNKLLKSNDLSTNNVLSASNNSQQQYENTTFYVDVQQQTFEDKKKSKPKQFRKDDSEDHYENTEFHAPRRALSSQYIEVVLSDTSPASQTTETDGLVSSPNIKTLTRKKSKSEKSLKSKFRKSMGPEPNLNLGASFNGTRSTFYISDSVDVDSGVFTNSGTITPPKAVDPNSLSGSTQVSSSRQSIAISPEVTQRKSSLTARPINPPPPPPNNRKSMPSTTIQATALASSTKRLGTTSWYAECGVFKSDALKAVNQSDTNGTDCGSGGSVISSGTNSQQKDRANSSSWYADAGLYQTSGASVASSSGSSGVSTGGSGDDHSHSMFLNEPLYQIYSAAKLEVSSNINLTECINPKKKQQQRIIQYMYVCNYYVLFKLVIDV